MATMWELVKSTAKTPALRTRSWQKSDNASYAVTRRGVPKTSTALISFHCQPLEICRLSLPSAAAVKERTRRRNLSSQQSNGRNFAEPAADPLQKEPEQTACLNEFNRAMLPLRQVSSCILTKARVAQWQSRGLISPWSQVQILPLAPSLAKNRGIHLPTMSVSAC